MLQDPDRTRRAGAPRALPPAALAELRDAFAGEVARRLPRLQQLVSTPGDAGVLGQALRDAHALGSSAVVVGEAEASRCARALEAELTAHVARPSPALPPAVPAHVHTLSVLLGPWLAA